MKNCVIFGLMVSAFCCSVQAQEKADEQLKQEVRRAVQKALNQDAEAQKQSIGNKRVVTQQEKTDQPAAKELTDAEKQLEIELAKLEKNVARLERATSKWFWEKW